MTAHIQPFGAGSSPASLKRSRAAMFPAELVCILLLLAASGQWPVRSASAAASESEEVMGTLSFSVRPAVTLLSGKLFTPFEGKKGYAVPRFDRGPESDIVVTNTNDSGPGSLRQAILDSNANSGTQSIGFNIPGGGVHTIRPTSPLPQVSDSVVIDGYTQPGASPNTLTTGDNAVLLIELDGTTAGANIIGLQCIVGVSRVSGLVINRFGAAGIRLDSNGNTIDGNFLGTSADGTSALGDRTGVSIFSANNLVGGQTPAARNIISGNSSGIFLLTAAAVNNQFQGNYIGTNANGTAALANGNGISLFGPNNLVGGTTAAARNVISGNGSGIIIQNTDSSGNQVQGNFIGTDVAGTTAIPNTTGVVINDGSTSNTIGGSNAAGRNLISGNTQDGVVIGGFGNPANSNVVAGNLIGTNAAGTAGLPNGFSGVALFGVSGNIIGGLSAAERNLISGNGTTGILIAASGGVVPSTNNTVIGNYIGTDVNGNSPLANNFGVTIYGGSSGNLIGGTSSGARNLISGNSFEGVLLGPPAPGNFIQGNYIGTNAAGTATVSNGRTGVGVYGVTGNVIGGPAAGAGNLISGNTGAGVNLGVGKLAQGQPYIGSTGNLVQGNLIGTDVTGTVALGNGSGGAGISLGSANNTVRGNLISGNSGFGITLFRNHFTDNQGDSADILPDGNVIAGNVVGLKLGGGAALGNGFDGISIFGGANNLIGGTAVADRNTISGNAGTGVLLGVSNIFPLITPSTNNVVAGNYIGTDASGMVRVGNRDGVIIDGSSNNIIGGTTPGSGNLISGNNSGGGIGIRGTDFFDNLQNHIQSPATGNRIQGNLIGTDASGNSALGNAGNAIGIGNSQNNLIGGMTAAARNVISGNISQPNGTGHGIVLDRGATGNSIQGNYIGTNATGSSAMPNGRDGIFIFNGAANNVVGGLTSTPGTPPGNVISGNADNGVNILGPVPNLNFIGSHDNQVLGNLIGTDQSGTVALPNVRGVQVIGNNNTIGGTGGARNVVSGNSLLGVIAGVGATGNRIQGNYIGTTINGSGALGNGQIGVYINSASNNIVGGLVTEGNTVAFNNLGGIFVASGTGNTFEGNSIFSNGTSINQLGIDLGVNGVTLNDTNDGDTGANNLQNFPIIHSANSIAGQTAIGGTLNSTPSTGFTVEFFSNAACDPSGNGEGQTFIGASTVTTNAAGNANIISNLGVPLSSGQFVTATATNNTTGDTSEFSACTAVTSDDAFPVISGQITSGPNFTPVPGVTVNLTGATTATTTTDSNGHYFFSNVQFGGNYTVVPSAPNLFFSPANRVFNGLTGNQPGTDFTASTLFPAPRADYQFNGNLGSSVGGPPSMTNLTGSGGANFFQTDVVDGYTRQTLRFPFNSGVSLDTAGVIPNNTYTIAFLFKFDDVSGFRRGIDFKNGTSDAGAYVKDGRAEPEPLTNAPFEAGTYIQAVLTRDASGVARVYRDGFLRATVNDVNNDLVISPANVLRFFQDDFVDCCEASAGNVARIRLWDFPLATAQVQSLDRLANANGGGDQSVLFNSNRDGRNEIYSMNADGSNQRRLTNDSLQKFGGRWSPDGQRIVFSTTTGGLSTRDRVWIMNSDGSGQMALTTGTSNDHNPTWKADGTKILFSRCDDFFRCDLYTMNPDGSNQVQITSAPEDEEISDWSPDGSRITFERGPSVSEPVISQIYSILSDGTGRTQLTNVLAPTLDNNPRFSRDARKITFTREGNSSDQKTYEIWVMNSDGSAQTQLTNNATYDAGSVWSSDGLSILFSSRRDNAVTDIYSMSPTGDSIVRLTRNSAGDGVTDVRPQASFGTCQALPIGFGQSIAGNLGSGSCFVNGNNTDLYSFSADDGQQVAVTIDSTEVFSRIELLDDQGTVIASSGSDFQRGSRLPASGYFTLPTDSNYTIRAIGAGSSSGAYTISLFAVSSSSPPCTYQVSPSSVLVPAAGGTFSFYVVTQPNCPPAPSPSSSGGFFSVDSYAGGRVTYTVRPNPSASARQGSISVAGGTFTFTQFGNTPPPNDGASAPQILTGTSSPTDAPITGTNAGASSQPNEPSHAPGNAPGNSVWYAFKPATGTSGLYSFTTSGSSFDTVMSVYACPGGDPCTFAQLERIGSNDDTTSFDTTSKVNFRASAGRLYMIAIDGKNGATGTIKLSWRQYQQLYRLYLQTYNGDPSPLTPDQLYATPDGGVTRVVPVTVSQSVYEFDLPLDGRVYFVNIVGPAGIRWNPNNFPLNSSFAARHGEDDASGGGTQNFVSNSENETDHFIRGYIKNLNTADVGSLSLTIGSSRGPNPHAPVPCNKPVAADVNGVTYGFYECISQPQTLHDIVPSEANKIFNLEVKSFDQPFVNDFTGSPLYPFFTASDAPTYSVGGKVLAGGAGTIVTLTYTPKGNALAISQQTTTAADGSYKFENLPPNYYTLRARRSGFVFNDPPAADVKSDTTINIGVAKACTYSASGITTLSSDGGPAQFTITPNDQTCEWSASTSTSWIKINSGATVGNGPVHLIIDPNKDQPRTGSVTVGGNEFSIQQRAANTITVSVNTVPEGLTFTVDRVSYTSSQNFEWVAGSTHSIGTSESQHDALGGTYNFSRWSDGGAAVHDVTPNSYTAYSATFSAGAPPAAVHRSRFDFDGDGKADIVVRRPSNNIWYLLQTTAGFTGLEFGVAGDRIVPADYDGDGKTDIGIFRPSIGMWFIFRSSDRSFATDQFGTDGDLPVPADYDGDGKADLAVFRPSNNNWYRKMSGSGAIAISTFGNSGDRPQIGDFDGDGRADLAVISPSNKWSVQQSFAGPVTFPWGAAGDIAAPADYDGDGSTDLAVFRPSTGKWFVYSLKGTISTQIWGASGDIPVAADYDGDGKTDFAVFRPSNSTWYLYTSSSGIAIFTFGNSEDTPIPSAFSY